MKMLSMLKFSIPLLCVSALHGQYSAASNSPDCYFTEVLTSATRTSTFDNRELRCSVWRVQYVNLSNAPASVNFDRSTTAGSVWYTDTTSGTAATTAGSFTTNFDSLYVSINLTSKGTGNVIVAISGYSYKGNKNSPASATPNNVPMTVLNEVASTTITYTGYCKSIFAPATNTGYAICAVNKQTYDGSGNLVSVLWADGDAEENNIWANRASLTYQ